MFTVTTPAISTVHPQVPLDKAPQFLVIDLFCGMGGSSYGIEQARSFNGKVAKVIACVNHDSLAIQSHALNHPGAEHFIEDIRTISLQKLKAIADNWKAIYPDARLVIWASLECTNFSRAKGGKARNVDSRTLAENLYMHYNPATNQYELRDSYIQVLSPDYILIENVVEFMAWGEVDKNGKPISQKNGRDWLRWRQQVCSFGYKDNWSELNAANFGAPTARNRLFGIFAKHGLPACFPDATHAALASTDLFNTIHVWRPVKEVLNLEDKGDSIFNRKTPLSENTLRRIYKGLVKHIPAGEPAFLSLYYSNGGNHASLFNPSPVVPTKDRITLITPEFLYLQWKPTTSRYILYNPGWGGHTQTIDKPSCVIVARQDKAPMYLIEVENGSALIPVYANDSPMTRQIKGFMAQNGIINIRRRLLHVSELMQIQGFPKEYHIAGSQTQQKKFIGNAVVPAVAKAIFETLANANNIKQAS